MLSVVEDSRRLMQVAVAGQKGEEKMSTNFQLNAVARNAKGTNVSRKLRREGQIPAMVYGAGKGNQKLLLDSNEIKNSLGVEAFHSAIISLNTESGAEQVHVVAHSMGNLGFLRALERISQRMESRGLKTFKSARSYNGFRHIGDRRLKTFKSTRFYKGFRDDGIEPKCWFLINSLARNNFFVGSFLVSIKLYQDR